PIKKEKIKREFKIMSEKFQFECVDCRAEYPGDKVIYLCPACEKGNQVDFPPRGVLKTVYPYQRIRTENSSDDLFGKLHHEGFIQLLPIRSMKSWPNLRIGDTPLYQVETGAEFQDFELYLKDDSQNPTFSFKDRASALVSAWARENGINTLVAASTGNAGSSLAGICASQGQRAMIVVPASAPLAKLTQILMYGATLVPVRGTYDDAFDLSIQISKKYGFYNRNTAFNPLTIEGKKTVSFEIYRQMNHRVPDRIFIPVGDGVIFSGVCKGFEELLKLGIIDRMPILVAVQAEGSSNLISNLKEHAFVSIPSKTIADSISVDIPRCFFMTAHYMEEYHGETISVSDQEILQASLKLSRSTGIFSEPAAVAAYAGMLQYRDRGLIPAGSKNVVLLTGSGLKDLSAVQSSIHIPDPVEPDIRSLEALIDKHF
ncbi:MAG: threonine synthase, partial [Bacteroidota bacterium]